MLLFVDVDMLPTDVGWFVQIGEKLSYGETGRQRGVSARHGIDIDGLFAFVSLRFLRSKLRTLRTCKF